MRYDGMDKELDLGMSIKFLKRFTKLYLGGGAT